MSFEGNGRLAVGDEAGRTLRAVMEMRLRQLCKCESEPGGRDTSSRSGPTETAALEGRAIQKSSQMGESGKGKHNSQIIRNAKLTM
jgi:hypothetical protein